MTPQRLLRTTVLVLSTMVLTASAASDVTEVRREVIPTTVDHVLSVLSTSDICDSGCKYRGVDLVKEVKVTHRAKPDDFFKWSHIDNTKDTKFFTHYVITRGNVTQVKMRTLTEGKDAALIKELESKTGLPHAPIFDVAHTEYLIKPMADQCEVKVKATTTISGFVGMFPGKVKASMEESIRVLFENFKR